MEYSTCALIVPVLVSFLAYRYIQFMPPGALEPRNQMITRAFFRISNDIISFASLFGYSQIELRRSLLEFLPRPEPDSRVEATNELFDGVKVRIYRPKSAKNNVLPALVYYHGGGWMYNSIDTHDDLTRSISLQSNIVVVSVEYRFMPEHRFPAQFDDCLKATEYLFRNTKQYNVDPLRLGVGGDSAGGNLAAAVALKFAKEPKPGLPKIKLQVLLYPVLQAFDFNLPSFREYPDDTSFCYLHKGVIVNTVNMYGFQDQGSFDDISNNRHVSKEIRDKYKKYVNLDLLPLGFKERGGESPHLEEPNVTLAEILKNNITNPYMWPLMASDDELRKLPKTYIAVTEYDSLRDQDLIYAERLRLMIGENLTLKYWAGLEHGLYEFHHYKYYKVAIDLLAGYLRHNL